MSILSGHLEQISYACQGIDSLPYETPTSQTHFNTKLTISKLPTTKNLHKRPPLEPRYHIADKRHGGPRTSPLFRPTAPSTSYSKSSQRRTRIQDQEPSPNSVQCRIGRGNNRTSNARIHEPSPTHRSGRRPRRRNALPTTTRRDRPQRRC